MLTTCRRADGTVEVVEAPIGVKLSSLIRLTELPAQAVLVGGYHGAWLPRSVASKVRMSNTELRPLGAAVGAGVVVALPAGRCGIAESARVLRYLAAESAGQCGPCLNGLPRIANAMRSLAAGKAGPSVVEDLERWSGLVVGRGACKHPDGSVRFLRSALTTFAGEVQHHLGGQCSATDHTPFVPVPTSVPTTEQDWR
jgi:NADH:ubiquinone oxidoreductase subunit F (NADH-binding)